MITVMTPSYKKITARPFLNKKVKAVVDEEGIENYPLYLQVTYNRKSTQFPIKVNRSSIYENHELYVAVNQFEKDFLCEKKYQKEEVRVLYFNLERAISYELKLNGEKNFNVKGIGNKIDIYTKLLLPDYFKFGIKTLYLYLKIKMKPQELAIFNESIRYTSILDYLDYLLVTGKLKDFPEPLKNHLISENFLMQLSLEYKQLYMKDYQISKEINYLDWIIDQNYFKPAIKSLNKLSIELINSPKTVFGFKNYVFLKLEYKPELFHAMINQFVVKEFD